MNGVGNSNSQVAQNFVRLSAVLGELKNDHLDSFM